ncbi:MAG: DUF4407 domain-containing protein [Reichenbachiella sp.]|uniref:DUF4407 domain-containing protein n=1 Tax=Reichenbachiella sp. TaxID=2184521 RepID=UPI003267AE3F
MKSIERFFSYCSGASITLLKRCPIETSKYVGIGATIFFTGCLAALSSSYAMYFVFDSVVLPIAFGLVWGLMIFNLDRVIVLSMRKSELGGSEWLQALPRLMLAVLIALVISKPLELKIFEKEIATELMLMQQEIMMQNEKAVAIRYETQLDSLNNEKQMLASRLQEKFDKRDALLDLARQEADGTGGSGKVNPGPIYMIKKKNADLAQKELEDLIRISEQQGGDIDHQLSLLSVLKSKEISTLELADINGISFQLTALDRLGDKYTVVSLANWFIILLFIVLEVSPILVKVLSQRGPYDDLLEVHERQFEAYRKEKMSVIDNRLEELAVS